MLQDVEVKRKKKRRTKKKKGTRIEDDATESPQTLPVRVLFVEMRIQCGVLGFCSSV